MKRPMLRFIQVGELVRDWGGREGVKRNEHIGESLDRSVALNSSFPSQLPCLCCLSQ